MSMMHPEAVLITGTKDDPEDGSLRLYISRGSTGLHTHVPAEVRLGGLHNYANRPTRGLLPLPGARGGGPQRCRPWFWNSVRPNRLPPILPRSMVEAGVR